MQIAKPFLRGGVVLQPGEALPKGIDAETLAHYRRHGMVVDAAEPAGKARGGRRTATPDNAKTPTPAETKIPASETGTPLDPAHPSVDPDKSADTNPPAA